jgi:hypothetical protein
MKNENNNISMGPILRVGKFRERDNHILTVPSKSRG